MTSHICEDFRHEVLTVGAYEAWLLNMLVQQVQGVGMVVVPDGANSAIHHV